MIIGSKPWIGYLQKYFKAIKLAYNLGTEIETFATPHLPMQAWQWQAPWYAICENHNMQVPDDQKTFATPLFVCNKGQVLPKRALESSSSLLHHIIFAVDFFFLVAIQLTRTSGALQWFEKKNIINGYS